MIIKNTAQLYKMKILQLNNRVPFPLNDGGNIGVHYYTKGFLEAGADLSMLAMNTTRHWVELSQLPDLFQQLTIFKTVKVDNNVKILNAFLNLFKKSSYNIDRFISKDYKEALSSLLKNNSFDIIQLESLFLTPYVSIIRKHSNAKIVIRQHNVEFRIWERMAKKEKNFLKKKYFGFLAKRLKSFEIAHLDDYDLILPISKQDETVLKSLHPQKPMLVHPFGIHLDKIPFTPFSEKPISLYHIGAMDWLPNQESVAFFLNKVMPLVNVRFPELKLYLAGRNMPEYYFKHNWKNVIVVGEVPDAQAFEKDKSILVVPLQSGGGIRIKILQAMAMGKAIITTSMGVEGIEAKDNIEIMIADTPEAFAQKIAELTNNPHKIIEMGIAARKLIEEKYNRKKTIADLLFRYEQLLKQ